jgi:hypothetical protein
MARSVIVIATIVIFFSLAAFCGVQEQPGPSQQQPAPQQRPDRERGGRERFADLQRIFGTIKSVQADQLTIEDADGKSQVVKLTPDTRIRKDRQPAKASDFKAGDRVMVAGKSDASGTFVAQFVMAGQMRGGMGGGAMGMGPGGGAPPSPEDMVRMGLGKEFIAGEVKNIEETKLTILRPDGQTQVIQADESTSFRNDKGESVTLADIKPGDKVAGRGELKDGVFVPRMLRIGVQFPMRPQAGPQK